jgi:hypothetical protein
MVTKEQSLIGTEVVINDKKTEWNVSCGCKNNGMLAEKQVGKVLFGETQYEFLPHTTLVIVSKIKRLQGYSAKYIGFNVKGVDGINEKDVFYSFWINFKHKVNLK